MHDRPPRRPARRARAGVGRAPLVALAAALVLLLAGCGSASPPSPPTGVDGLVVPTPRPDPADFVAGLDSPWLALAPGTTRSYRTLEGDLVEVAVAAEPETVAGVAATAVRRSGGGVPATTDYLAQDRDGHVWWLGREGVWEAGVDGAQAGLVLPAEPRVGDGWRPALQPGRVEQRAEVLAVGEPVTTEEREYADTVLVEVTDLLTGEVRRGSYARGAGLVHDLLVTAGSDDRAVGTLVLTQR